MLRIQKGQGLGTGPYKDFLGKEIMDEWDFNTFNKYRHPGPTRDSILKDIWEQLSYGYKKDFMFGFHDEKQLRAWFDDNNVLEQLKNIGFKIIRYKIKGAKRCYVGQAQAIAHKDDMIYAGEHTLIL